METMKRFISGAVATVIVLSSFAVTSFAAGNSDGAYNVGDGILISSTDMSTDNVVTLDKENVQYDTGSSKQGKITFSDDDDVHTKAVTDIFSSTYTYSGVIDYAGTGKGKKALVIPINITAEKNYFAFVLTPNAGTINTSVDAENAKSPIFAVQGTDGVAYAIDCGTLTIGKHAITFDGASGAWLPDVCAVAIYPMDSKDFLLPYQNEELSFEERAADLVARMTVEEKVSQLGHNAAAIARLGVSSYYYWREGAHGVARQGKATSFPSSIAISNTWDPELYGQEAEIISTEARVKNSRYNLNYWSPTINMSRDPRWGRNEESLGEDTLLTTAFGGAFVEGMQGNDEKYIKTIATVKHFLANNCEGERQVAASEMTESELRDYYAKAFQNIVEDTNPGAIMSAYNATTVTRNGTKLWDYIAMPANKTILTDYLRRSWGFSGFVTGDCGAVADLNGNAFKRALFDAQDDDRPLSSIDQSETVALSIQAGNEMDCGSISTSYALEAVKKGYLSEDKLDIALFRVFLQRFKTGEFDNDTNTYRTYTAENDLETDESVAIAEKLAEESIVLLENKADNNGNKILPIEKNRESLNIALVGEMASQTYIGDYSGEPEKTTSPYEGLQEIFGKSRVHFLGHVDDDTPIMNVKNIKFLDKNNNATAIDLSGAAVTGATLTAGMLTNVTPAMQVKVSGVDFSKVVKVTADIEVPSGSIGGSISICYDSPAHPETTIESPFTQTAYATYEGAYTGADGGYNGSSSYLYITASAHSGFDMTAYKAELDAADVIIAYSSTMASNVKDADGQLTDCKESNDRTSIKIPQRDRENIEAICNQYADKTVIFMQSAGEMDVTDIKDKCRAILWTGYNGQKQGSAMAKILSGDVNPSGKLSTTWYAPADLDVMKVGGTSETVKDTNGTTDITWKRHDYTLTQKEGNDDWKGRTYMYYKGTPQYPFGYGLSYTDYTYSNLKLSSNSVSAGDKLTVSIDVANGVPGTKTCTKIVAEYSDGALTRITSIDNEFPVASIPAVNENTQTTKTFYWNSLKNIKPVTAADAETDTDTTAVDGTEIVEVYAAYQGAGTGISLPLRQLVGFARVDIGTNQKKVAQIEIDTNTLAHWSETALKNYIPTGEYKIYAGKNVTDDGNFATLTINGTLDSKIKTVYAVPSGIKVTGAYDSVTDTTAPIKTVTPNLSVVMTDEDKHELQDGEVTYTSSNNKIASVDADGTVKAGTAAGVATITASVTIGGVTKSTSFPIVCSLQKAISDSTRNDYLSELDTEYAKYSESDYRADFWTNLTNIYNQAKTDITTAVDSANLDDILSKAKTGMAAIRDHLKADEKPYTVTLTTDYYHGGEVMVAYNGDADEPTGTVTIKITDKDDQTTICTANMTSDQTVKISSKIDYNDEVTVYVSDGTDIVSNKVTETYQKPPAHIVYDLADSKYARFAALASGEKFEEINGVGGYGDFSAISDVSYSVNYDGSSYTLTGGFQGGKGKLTKTNVYFVPFDCYGSAKVTVFFDSSSSDRKVIIGQNNGSGGVTTLGEMGGAGNKKIQTLTVNAADLSKPVYIMPQTKESIYMIIVDYDGTAEGDNPKPSEPPEDDETYTDTKVEFEGFTKMWVNRANINADQTLVENTKNGDIFYFGVKDLTDLRKIELIAGNKNEADVTATFFAVNKDSITNIDTMDKAAIEALLTSESSIASAKIQITGAWTTTASNLTGKVTKKTGEYGLFVKLNTTGNYCGNPDYFNLKYAASTGGE